MLSAAVAFPAALFHVHNFAQGTSDSSRPPRLQPAFPKTPQGRPGIPIAPPTKGKPRQGKRPTTGPTAHIAPHRQVQYTGLSQVNAHFSPITTLNTTRYSQSDTATPEVYPQTLNQYFTEAPSVTFVTRATSWHVRMISKYFRLYQRFLRLRRPFERANF